MVIAVLIFGRLYEKNRHDLIETSSDPTHLAVLLIFCSFGSICFSIDENSGHLTGGKKTDNEKITRLSVASQTLELAVG